jgi:U3 small nucleolar RNA-associated protein 5
VARPLPCSNDRVLLERCLSSTNPRIIVNTVARLLPIDAAAFLRAAVDRWVAPPIIGSHNPIRL